MRAVQYGHINVVTRLLQQDSEAQIDLQNVVSFTDVLDSLRIH